MNQYSDIFTTWPGDDSFYEHDILNPSLYSQPIEKPFTPIKDHCDCTKCISDLNIELKQLKTNINLLTNNLVNLEKTVNDIKVSLPQKRTFADMVSHSNMYNSNDHNKTSKRFKLVGGYWHPSD